MQASGCGLRSGGQGTGCADPGRMTAMSCGALPIPGLQHRACVPTLIEEGNVSVGPERTQRLETVSGYWGSAGNMGGGMSGI